MKKFLSLVMVVMMLFACTACAEEYVIKAADAGHAGGGEA